MMQSILYFAVPTPLWDQVRRGERVRGRVASEATSGTVSLHPDAAELLNGRCARIQTNQNIAQLIQLTNNSTVAGLSGYLGQIVEIDSLVGELGADGIEWRYDMPEGVKGAKVSIQDQRGNVIYSQELSTTEGTASFEWNGETTNGADREDGFYQMIIQATDSSGEAVNVPARVRAQVSGIDLTTDQTAISMTAGAFYFDQVLRLAAAS